MAQVKVSIIETTKTDIALYHGTRAGNDFHVFDEAYKNKGVGSNAFNQGHYPYLSQNKDAAQWFADLAQENHEVRQGNITGDPGAGDILHFTLKRGAKLLRVDDMPRGYAADKLIQQARAEGVDVIAFKETGLEKVEGSERVANILNSGHPYDTFVVLNHAAIERSKQLKQVEIAPIEAVELENKLVRVANEMGIQVDLTKAAFVAERSAMPPNQKYVGRVVGVDKTMGFVYQELGRGTGTVHLVDSLSRVPVVGEAMSVSYRDGFGSVAVRQASRNQER